MTQSISPNASGTARIAPRHAGLVMLALSLLTLVAGFAASAQAHPVPAAAKPVQFVSGHQDLGMATAGRSAHRLCRSPIRFLGTAQDPLRPDCKRFPG